MKYEVIGVVSLEITPALRWDENGNANAAFDKLREKAGAIGANALLLDSNMSGATYTVNAGYYGTSYQVPMHRNPVTAEALAIYVIKN